MQIPKIIHLSVGRKGWSTTGSFVGFVSNMKEQHPDWTFIFWNGEKIDAFMAGHAEYRDVYNSYPYAVQRWDMIRYLILYEYGGIYADLDYECIDALDSLLENEFCCLASDPEEHARIFDKAHIVTNAFIAIEAGLRYMGLELISGKWYHA